MLRIFTIFQKIFKIFGDFVEIFIKHIKKYGSFPIPQKKFRPIALVVYSQTASENGHGT